MMADDAAGVAQFYIGPDRGRATPVLVPCCGRIETADSVVDTRNVVGTIVNGTDWDWMCSACRTRMIRDSSNTWSPSRLARQLGAPVAEIQVMRAKERVEELSRQTPDDFRPNEAYNTALDDVVAGRLPD